MVCGHGTRYRNLSCVVSDGSFNDEGSLVDDELCESLELTVDGFKLARLKEACTLPCPGNATCWSQLHVPLTHAEKVTPRTKENAAGGWMDGWMDGQTDG